MGVAFVILSFVHTPLPTPDYHNIRHHDGPGEFCALHEHLLRWHPGAGEADDVAVLHWHWLAPGTGLPEPGQGPSWHAPAPDWPLAIWDHGPNLIPEAVARRVAEPPAPAPAPGDWVAPVDPLAALDAVPSPPPLAFSATFAPRTDLAALLQRWAC